MTDNVEFLDQSDRVQVAAFATIDRAAPFFDLSDTSSDTDGEVAATPKIRARVRIRCRSKSPLSPIASSVPYPIELMFPEKEPSNAAVCKTHIVSSITSRPWAPTTSDHRSAPATRSRTALSTTDRPPRGIQSPAQTLAHGLHSSPDRAPTSFRRREQHPVLPALPPRHSAPDVVIHTETDHLE